MIQYLSTKGGCQILKFKVFNIFCLLPIQKLDGFILDLD